jgi:hypothetical protein
MTATGERTPTSTEALGVTGFGDFAIGDVRTYTFAVHSVGNGTVEGTPVLDEIDDGTQVTLIPRPAPGHAFLGWERRRHGRREPAGDARQHPTASSRRSSRTESRPRSRDVVRSSALPISPAMRPATSGTHRGSVSRIRFVEWAGDVAGTTNPVTVTMDDNAKRGRPVRRHHAARGAGAAQRDDRAHGGADHAALGRGRRRGVKEVDLDLSRNGAVGPFARIASGQPNTGAFDWTATGPATSRATLRVTARDSSGNSGLRPERRGVRGRGRHPRGGGGCGEGAVARRVSEPDRDRDAA